MRSFSFNRKDFLKIIPTLIFVGGLFLATTPVYANISFDSNSSSQGDTANLSWPHTVGNSPNRILLVGLSIKNTVTADSVIYNGILALTHIGAQTNPGDNNRIELWYLLSPPSGTANIEVTLSAGANIIAGAISYSGVDQFTPLGPFIPNSGRSTLPTVTVNSATGEIVFSTVSVEGQAGVITAGAGQTEQWNLATGAGGGDVIGSGSTETGAASVTMTWSYGSDRDWTIGAVAIKPKIIIPSSSGTVLFPTRATPPSGDAAELERINYIESLGYTVLQIYQRASSAEYVSALSKSDVVYISERVLSTDISANLKNGCTGVVTEEMNLNDDFGIVSGNGQWDFYDDRPNNRVTIQRMVTDHYILQDFPMADGDFSLFGSALSQDLQFLDDAPYPASYELLAFHPGDLTLPTLVAIEAGGLLADGSNASGRRVVLPWMQSASGAGDFNSITANGEAILRRSLEWAQAETECSFMQKRSFLPDGTPLANGAQVGTGTEIKFMIYINNQGTGLSDISVQDILDPTFNYVPGSLQIDNSVAECALNTCTSTEESNIFSAVDATLLITDSINGDGASFDGTNTIDTGDQNVPGNGTINVNANSVWALLFSVTIN